MESLAPVEVADRGQRFLAGSPQAFEPLYRAHRDRLYRVAWLLRILTNVATDRARVRWATSYRLWASSRNPSTIRNLWN